MQSMQRGIPPRLTRKMREHRVHRLRKCNRPRRYMRLLQEQHQGRKRKMRLNRRLQHPKLRGMQT